MSWYAKPSGGYGINSDEAKSNMFEIYNMLKDTWTIEAICGMLGNMVAESGLNPWRWQSDSVSTTSDKKGYGLPQFTPAYGYINDYGKDTDGYAPNLSVHGVTEGANASDGKAQIIVINEDRAHKFIERTSYCTYYDISSAYPFSSYKKLTNLYTSTVGWLFNYEFPNHRSEGVANERYANAQICYQILTGEEPPTPPTPPPYPPVPPDPPTPSDRHKMPLYMYLRKR